MTQKQLADRQGSLKMGERSGLPRHNPCHRAFGNTVRKPWIAPFRQHRNKRFRGGKYEKTACFHTHRHISPEYRWDTVLCISFLFDKKPSGITCIPPSNDALKPFDGIIQMKKRLGYPNRFFIVSTKKHRSESERCLVREMGLEPTRQRHTHLKRACLPIPALSHIFWPV